MPFFHGSNGKVSEIPGFCQMLPRGLTKRINGPRIIRLHYPRGQARCKNYRHEITTVDGRYPANQLRLVAYPNLIPLFTSFLHPRWCRISSINSSFSSCSSICMLGPGPLNSESHPCICLMTFVLEENRKPLYYFQITSI